LPGVFLQDLTYVDVAFGEQPSVRQEKSDEVIASALQWQTSVLTFKPIHALQSYLGNMKVCNPWRSALAWFIPGFGSRTYLAGSLQCYAEYLDEREAYVISLVREPPSKKSSHVDYKIMVRIACKICYTPVVDHRLMFAFSSTV
jgi:hypothetical protein